MIALDLSLQLLYCFSILKNLNEGLYFVLHESDLRNYINLCLRYFSFDYFGLDATGTFGVVDAGFEIESFDTPLLLTGSELGYLGPCGVYERSLFFEFV